MEGRVPAPRNISKGTSGRPAPCWSLTSRSMPRPRKIKHPVHVVARERLPFSTPLNLNQSAGRRHHHIAINVGRRIFAIVEIKPCRTAHHPDTDRHDFRLRLENPYFNTLVATRCLHASSRATCAPVIAPACVLPSACRTFQSTTICRLPSAFRSMRAGVIGQSNWKFPPRTGVGSPVAVGAR